MGVQVATAQQAPSTAEPALAPGTFRLTVTEEHLSLEAQDASVAAIFREIGQQTGIRMTIHPGVDETITMRFARVPLRDALKRLAKNVAIVTTQAPNAPPHRIAKVYVFAAGQAGVVSGGRGPTRPPAATAKETAPRPPTATAKEATPRPEPFKFTFDPSQHIKPSQ
jgi:hypothetical protein